MLITNKHIQDDAKNHFVMDNFKYIYVFYQSDLLAKELRKEYTLDSRKKFVKRIVNRIYFKFSGKMLFTGNYLGTSNKIQKLLKLKGKIPTTYREKFILIKIESWTHKIY